MIVFFDIFRQIARENACIFHAEVGKSYIQNMSFMYLQYKYNIL